MTINELLKKSKMTQTEFANRYGIPKQTMNGWINGTYEPPSYVVSLLSRAREDDAAVTDKEISDIRALTGLSQVPFCKRYGIPRRTLEDWERHISEPPDYVKALLYRAVRNDVESGMADS